MPQTPARGYELADFAAIAPVECPCGLARRAFTDVTDFCGTVHITQVTLAARRHYHKRLSEVYYFLECQPEAAMELDGEHIPVRAGQCLLIRPGTRHCALGEMKVLIVCLPKFDPDDEWFD